MAQTSSDSSNNKTHRTLTESHKRQIELLQIMSDHISPTPETRQFEISEISQMTTFNDEKEVQRYLLILEGQKLVSPYPKGDFTSNRWYITKQGLRAVRTITRATVQ